MFVDESGDASLNHAGKDFYLAAVIIRQEDFKIIQGYLRLLKRKYLADDYYILHATDLFERPYMSYRRLLRPDDNVNKFINRLQQILMTIPFHSCIYHVDKDRQRTKHSYTPAKGKSRKGLNLDLPYELAATEAIIDFSKYLSKVKSTGEIVIESRLNKDSNFVGYFDNTRKPHFPGGISNPHFREVMNNIPSLFISNKDSGNVGLELADLAAYVTYRKFTGDPYAKMKLPKSLSDGLFYTIKKSAFRGTPSQYIHRI
jgi:hypothetical protein